MCIDHRVCCVTNIQYVLLHIRAQTPLVPIPVSVCGERVDAFFVSLASDLQPEHVVHN